MRCRKNDRFEIIKWLKNFLDNYRGRTGMKGLYLTGNFGCGKTYLISAALNELAKSIRQHGIIQPLVLRKLNDNKYEIIAGERRYRAAKLVGITEIPVIIKTADEQQMAELALIENLQRQDLSAIEEAKSYEEIMKIGNQTQASLADKIGKSQSFVANKIRLLSLPEEIQDALANKKISERHARSLISVKNESKQIELLNRIITEKYHNKQKGITYINMFSKGISIDEVVIKELEVIAIAYIDYLRTQNLLTDDIDDEIILEDYDNNGVLVSTISGKISDIYTIIKRYFDKVVSPLDYNEFTDEVKNCFKQNGLSSGFDEELYNNYNSAVREIMTSLNPGERFIRVVTANPLKFEYINNLGSIDVKEISLSKNPR